MSIWFVDSVRFAFYLVWIHSANAASNTEKLASAGGVETETARGFVWCAQIPAPRTIQDRRMSACERNLQKSRPSGAHPPAQGAGQGDQTGGGLADGGFGQAAVRQGGPDILFVVGVARHDDVVASPGAATGHSAVLRDGGVPVRHDQAGKTPFLPQYDGAQVPAVGGVHPVDAIVMGHFAAAVLTEKTLSPFSQQLNL